MSETQTIQFRFGQEAREYFDKIDKNSTSGKFKIKLQAYWLCAQIGILYNEKGTPPEKKWLVDYFAPPLKSYEDLIRAFAFWRHAKTKNLNPKKESEMLPALDNFFDENARTKLDKIGMNTFDKHAAGGFEIIRDRIGEETDLASFLLEYLELIENAPEN